ncbi:TetR/AcrR family transcriptional regulator [Salinibacterium sp. ZJ450]|uniref:TetR/AcrR family transcriptional regulator n=1 Tax=Salinibacterium sp. ZJ450 TaxID=2708338 RepID=UPI00142367CE|nr:TetR/AcrR family transcriptional regulator [Salinibacterium sp. ZJ450]
MARNESPAALSAPDIAAVAIELLAERGYDATSVGELADALEVSRSTFFRRFKTKEDIVFADHTYLLERLANSLADDTADPFAAVNAACLVVLKYHMARPESTLKRHALLRSNPSLRERELVMSHRYERIFRDHLKSRLQDDGDQSWVASAYAAAAVAVHNDALRGWFEDESIEVAAILQRQLGELAQAFRSRVSPAGQQAARVVVAVYDPSAPAEAILDSIRGALSPTDVRIFRT